jgi:hypothetical protein
MPLAIYLDHHVPRAITLGLGLRGVDVLTAYEDGASELGRVIFTRDDDLLAEAAKRQEEGILFQGVIYAHQMRVSIGKCVQDLEMTAKVGEPADLMNGIMFLPL